jgi:hypothetical protein
MLKNKWISTNMKLQATKLVLFVITILFGNVFAQVGESEKSYVRIGEMQSHFSAYGSERAWNNTYYEGLRWPADYKYTDNAVIKRAWIAVKDFTDASGNNWEYWATYISKDYVGNSIFPIQLSQSAKFELPSVYVDGVDCNLPYYADYDTINPNQIADRIVTNIINTSCGLTMTRRVYAFSQQYHDDYFIKEFIFENTGNIDYDDEIELDAPLTGVCIGWGTRYSVSRDGASNSDNQQTWGKHSWVTRRGEEYNIHCDDVYEFTESTPRDNLDWIRCAFSWMGQSEVVSYDMIGAPDIRSNGRLSGPQFAGSAVLHVDKSSTDTTDNPNQPTMLGWHAGDTYPSVGNLTESDKLGMLQVYSFLSGNPYPNEGMGGDTRMDELYLESITHKFDPYKVHEDGGGTNVWITYGPFDLNPGESVRIVEAEAVNGLDRAKCNEIGSRWLQAYLNPLDTGPFILPEGTQTNDKDVYKNSWFYTGMDSIMLVFSRAVRNYNTGFNIPQPPLPPPRFYVNSGGDKIALSWELSPSEGDPDFAGYRIYRGIGRPDTSYTLIAELPAGVDIYEDRSAIRGFAYYYYITAVNNGSNNQLGITNPIGPLESGRFYTRTTKPANLQRQPGSDLESIKIVPNPFTISNRDLQYIGEDDKVMFLNIPGYCKIKIYTERGDLVNTIIHNDGSGDQAYILNTSSRQVLVSGIYIAHFEVTQDPSGDSYNYKKGDTIYKKFIVIR